MTEVWNSAAGHADPGITTLIAVIDAAPAGAIIIDGDRVVHRNSIAVTLLGLEEQTESLAEAVRASRAVRPDALAEAMTAESADGALHSYHLVESPDGNVRCLEFRVHDIAPEAGRRVVWIKDVTDTQQLRQFRLLAEIGRSRGKKFSTRELGQQLVDAIINILNLDIAVVTVCERDVLRPVASRGMMLEDGFVLEPAYHLYVQKAVLTGKPVVGDGSEWESGELAELSGFHYIVPLLNSGTVVGTLHLGSLDSSDPFQTPEMAANASRFTIDTLDAAFLDALSAYAGSALANVALFEEIRDERAKIQTVVDAIPDGIVVFDGRGEVQIVNAAAREIAEVTWSSLNVDRRPYRLRDRDGKLLNRSDWPFFAAVRNGAEVLDDRVIMDFGDRFKQIDVTVVPVPMEDAKIPVFVATLQDVTSQSQLQRNREELVSVASHELRSPLTPLTGFLQMLRKQAEAGEEVDPTLIARAEQQVTRLSRLIETLLDVTRIESGRMHLEFQPVDLREPVARLVELWRAHPKAVQLKLTLPQHPVIASVDLDRFEQVLTNLMDNAVKHTSAGDAIRVVVDVDDDECVVCIHDHGSGIDSDVLPLVFERFFSTAGGGRPAGGMGLGLYITRQIVERHGGAIDIASEKGKFTEVSVRLPISKH